MGRIFFVTIVAVLSACPPNTFGQTVEVPLEHRAYELLDRLRTRGLLPLGTMSSRPISRNTLLEALLAVDRQASAELNAQERAQIDYLFYEFSEEIASLAGHNGAAAGAEEQRQGQSRWVGWLPGPVYANDRNLLALEEENFRFFFDPIWYRDGAFNDPDTLSSQDRVLQNISGFTFWGTFAGKIGFYLNSRDTKEHGTRTYPSSSRITWPRFGFARGHGTHIYHDETVAYLYLALPVADFEVGKNFNRWGPGRTGALALGDYATSYDQIKLRVEFWKASFTYVHGFLRQHPPVVTGQYEANGVERQIFASKYLAAHRLEIAPLDWLRFGVHETVIYGERGIELAYLNPIMFFRSAEHFLGDRDNATMGADLEVRPRAGVRFYGELFVDDFSVARIGENWYGNKTAWLAGLHLTDPLGLPDSDWRFELVHIDPYVYTHTFPINVYQNYQTTLGHWSGPNSELLYVEWLFWPQRNWWLALTGERWRHGANPAGRNVGGDIDRAFHVRDDQTVTFLDGILERRDRLRLEGTYEFFRNLRLTLALEHTRFRNAPAADGRRTVSTFTFFVGFGLNAD